MHCTLFRPIRCIGNSSFNITRRRLVSRKLQFVTVTVIKAISYLLFLEVYKLVMKLHLSSLFDLFIIFKLSIYLLYLFNIYIYIFYLFIN